MRQDDLSRTTDRTTDRTTGTGGAALVHSRDLDDFELAKGEADPRGWDVRTVDGAKLGKVSDLLVDTSVQRVRYLEIQVDKDLAKKARRDYFLVPIGTARLDDERDDVIVDLSVTELADIPLYERERLSRDYERSLRSYLHGRSGAGTSTGAGAPADADFYTSADYDDRSFFGARRRGTQGSGAADRATKRGFADRVTDAVDDVKDRIDANPASRPGPDATDRRI